MKPPDTFNRGHNSEAAVVADNRIVLTPEEQRCPGKKHEESFPDRAEGHCLGGGKFKVGNLSYVVFYRTPLEIIGRLLETFNTMATPLLRQPQSPWPS
jgi:predicted NodU family carbamoyl transferase